MPFTALSHDIGTKVSTADAQIPHMPIIIVLIIVR